MFPGLLARGRLADHPVWRKALAADELAARLVLPVIVSDAVEDRERVSDAGGLWRISITEAVREARAAAAAGIAGLLVFGAPERKDESAMIASQRDHVVPRAVRAVKDAVPDLAVATDVCVCAYTTHGQCVLFASGGADIAGTHARLAEIAAVHADAGADLIVPSGMLDGTVAAIRAALSGEHGSLPVAAMAKVESALYEMLRIALGATPIAERAVPLLDPTDRSAGEARVRRDVAAGADLVIVKPAMLALDLVASLAATCDRPVVAHHTADEHTLFSAETDVDGHAAEREMLAASRRAGAELVIAHGALTLV
ncbi:MAG: porphobilinogen synthase [Chloroflexi bacterium]|nr:porphobilinogen synthase [Chloroflexota bacterium]